MTTLDQHAQNMASYAAVLASTKLIESVYEPAGNELLGTTINRIKLDSKNTAEQPIGTYSRKPGYYSQDQFVGSGFQGKGKTGKPTKTMYIEDGYSGFRRVQGRNNPVVNVNLSGDTFLRYQMDVQGSKLIFGMTTQKASDIRKGQEKRFGANIYASSKQELEEFNKNVAEGLAALSKQVLNG